MEEEAEWKDEEEEEDVKKEDVHSMQLSCYEVEVWWFPNTQWNITDTRLKRQEKRDIMVNKYFKLGFLSISMFVLAYQCHIRGLTPHPYSGQLRLLVKNFNPLVADLH